MPKVKLKVIPKPAEGTRSVWVKDGAVDKRPFSKGQGRTHLMCGACGHTLAEKLDSSTQMNNIVLCCPACGAFNDSGEPTN